MEYSAFININDLTDEAKKELATYFEFLLFRDKNKKRKKRTKKEDRFDEFLANTIKVDQFQMLSREERNER